ncbi:MAG: magnesium transporter [Alphaproteobacteria bacterium]|nr:magnesium transporter [Alphaproteobacteria bacterium]
MLQTENPNTAESETPVFERIRYYLDEDNSEGLVELIEPLSLSDALRELLQLSPDERDRVLSKLPAETAAELIEEAPNELAVGLVERLEAETAADIIEELHSDVQADVIGELDEEDAEAILAEMDADEAADVRRLAAYEDETAGGLMIAEAFTFHENDTVGQVLRRLASEDEDFERYRGQHPYILDGMERPVGVVSLRGLLTAKRSALLPEVMESPLTVPVDATLKTLQDVFDEHPFLGVPVVEADGRLVGVVSRSAVDEAALERAESDSLKLQGVVGDELRSMPLTTRSRRRLAWLSANIVLNIVAASVIAAYEETLAAVIAIAIFLPMVSDMSGCSGNQAVAVSMRELSLGLVKPIDALRVWYKEASVGLINGAALGLLIGVVAWVWKGNPYLGLVIGLALAINTLISVTIGGVVPLLLKHIGQDPAVASGPLLTTITDVAGFFLVLSLATVFMPLLA